MKKLLALAIGVLMMLPLGADAQDQKIMVGIKAGLTSTWIIEQSFYGEPEIDYAAKFGNSIGISVGYAMNNHLSVHAEFHLSQQGQKYEGTQNIKQVTYDVQRDISLNYVQIPVLLKYSFGDKNTRFRVMAGVQFGSLQKASQEYTRDGQKLGTTATDLDGNTFVTDDTDITERFESSDFGVVTDLGVDFGLSDMMFLSTGFRTNYGLSEINSAPYRLNNLDGEYTPSNNAWGGLYVGLILKL